MANKLPFDDQQDILNTELPFDTQSEEDETDDIIVAQHLTRRRY